MSLQLVKRNKNKGLELNESGKAQSADGSLGMNGVSLVYNVCLDLDIGQAPKDMASLLVVFSEKVEKFSDMKVGDIIIFAKGVYNLEMSLGYADVMIYMGNNKVCVVDNAGVHIIDFKEDDKTKYMIRRNSKIAIATPILPTTQTVVPDAAKGDDAASVLWRMLTTELGFTAAGAAGFMGNVRAESGMKTNNVYDGWNIEHKMSDEELTKKVNETKDKSYFMNKVAAYGLCQWTNTRKDRLWKHTIDNNRNIDDVTGQVETIKEELGTVEYYKNTVTKYLKAEGSVYNATIRCLVNFETPSYGECQSSEKKRYEYAKEYYKTYTGNDVINDPQTLHYTWYWRTVKNGTKIKMPKLV